jgi:hypothetical protein
LRQAETARTADVESYRRDLAAAESRADQDRSLLVRAKHENEQLKAELASQETGSKVVKEALAGKRSIP